MLSSRRRFPGLILSSLLAISAVPSSAEHPAAAAGGFAGEKVQLHKNWELQSSCDAKAAGEEISKPGFVAQKWHRAEVPSTVVAALVADKTFPDPYYGMNLKSLPGMNYSSEVFFANQPMPEGSPFKCSWWYRTEFQLPAAQKDKEIWLHLDGVNYRANVWVNGHKIADAADVAGTFRIFEFNISKVARPGALNALAVESFAPDKSDLAITWVDWNPTPPDKDMGLWKDVYLTNTGPVALRQPFVASKLEKNYTAASLTVSVLLKNVSDRAVNGALQVDIEGLKLRQSVQLAAGEEKLVSFTPEKYPQLELTNPRLWWPYQMGKPNLYSARLWFESGGQVSDSAHFRFGVREMTSELTAKNNRLFKVNGKNILVRGGGWTSDMLLRWSPKRLKTEMEYTRHMGLNTIRMEGKLERDEFYDLADEMGILLMPGWCCCDMWEKWGNWSAETYKIAGTSLVDQVHRLRNHPSVMVWHYGSDNPPPEDVEKMYVKILQDEHWPNPAISSDSQTPTSVTGESGVKMSGPYDYVPPNYWLTDTQAGGAFGFNTETSPGPAIPPLESLKRFIPADHLWPRDEYWSYHAGGERFTTIKIFNNGMDQRYGKPADLTDFLRKSEAMAYEGERAMFEAYARNKYDSTGVIQWMLNNGWPSIIWHLYDYYLVPAGGYFGTKKACEQAHVQYSYDNDTVTVINGFQHPLAAMKVAAQIYSLDAKLLARQETTLDLPTDSSSRAFALKKVANPGPAYFLRLELRDSSGKLVSENFYWLSTKSDVLDWPKRDDTVYTPQSAFADLTGLNQLPRVRLEARQQQESSGGQSRIHVEVRNPGPAVAFMVKLRLTRGTNGDDVLPIFWDDNYFSLLPGERRQISGTFETADAEGKEPTLEVSGWNVAPSEVAAAPPRKTQ